MPPLAAPPAVRTDPLVSVRTLVPATDPEPPALLRISELTVTGEFSPVTAALSRTLAVETELAAAGGVIVAASSETAGGRMPTPDGLPPSNVTRVLPVRVAEVSPTAHGKMLTFVVPAMPPPPTRLGN